MRKFIKGDEVVVITGKSKGTIGMIVEVLGDKVIVKGANTGIKHVKPDMNKGIVGGRVDHDRSIHISNIAIYNRKSSKRDKVQFMIKDGKKIRCYRSNGEKVLLIA